MRQFFLLMVACRLLCAAHSDVMKQSLPPFYYRVVVAPNPKLNTGVVAIVPIFAASKSKSGSRDCASVAFRGIRRVKEFKTTQIFVFQSEDFANGFRLYQKKRKGAPLKENDYRQLTHFWKGVSVCAIFDGEKPTYYYPQDKPSSWWKPLVQKP